MLIRKINVFLHATFHIHDRYPQAVKTKTEMKKNKVFANKENRKPTHK